MDNMTKCPESSHRTFIPFGQGSHSCVGMRLAVMCIKLSLTEVIQRFRFSRATNSQVHTCIYIVYTIRCALHVLCIYRTSHQVLSTTYGILMQRESALRNVHVHTHTVKLGLYVHAQLCKKSKHVNIKYHANCKRHMLFYHHRIQ